MRHRAIPIFMAAAMGLAAFGADVDAVRPASSKIGVYSNRANVHDQLSNMKTDGSRLIHTTTSGNARYLAFGPDSHNIALAAGPFICCPQPRRVSTQVFVGIGPGSPARILLTDPRGRLAGTEFGTGKSVADIPSSTFMEGDHPAIIIDKAIQGKYTLDVVGMGSGGAFRLHIAYPNAFPNDFDITGEEVSETIAPGQRLRFTFDAFAFQGVANLFAAFSARLEINSTVEALEMNTAAPFKMNSTFTLRPGAEIAPATQPVAVQLGRGFLAMIPSGSFHSVGNGTKFVFNGIINGVPLEGSLTPTGGSNYALKIAGTGARNLPSWNPVEVRLGIGNNGGSVSVDAQFVR